jgi:hypothetical protein
MIVVPVAVDVVDNFALLQGPTELLLRNDSVDRSFTLFEVSPGVFGLVLHAASG